MSLVDQQAKDDINNLQKLRHSLREHANVVVAVMVHRVCDELQAIGRAISSFFKFSIQRLISCVEVLQLLSEVKFAERAYDDIEDPKTQCLRGTRTEIIQTILQWATLADWPNPKKRIARVPKLSARVL